ncbi:hypothetical protein ABIF44_003721 [Bradyrhizobium japonicum]|nr:hypothetical protein [Bradyrhizobium japonicum]MCS3989977.1 hypothetical protein [Bradyrhizobium japonicum]MCS4015210.1 hypothetical protein [Bradyrhizobium japonicum]MCS4202304.1 hypothetical protein [Bradyrhizobium japonicum]MDH6174560.1 hypothetical protein [Bradyrhizobium japonicum]
MASRQHIFTAAYIALAILNTALATMAIFSF